MLLRGINCVMVANNSGVDRAYTTDAFAWSFIGILAIFGFGYFCRV